MLTPHPKLNSFSINVKATRTAIHVVPDFGSSILTTLSNFAMLVTNVNLMLVRSTPFKVGTKRVNPKSYYNHLKSEFQSSDLSRIKVVKRIKSVPKSNAVIVDHSKTAEAIEYFANKTSKKIALSHLFNRISQEMKLLDSEMNEKIDHIIVFSVSHQDGLIQVLQALKQVDKSNLLMEYGNVGKGAFINVETDSPALIQLLGYNSKNKFTPSLSIFGKVLSRLPKELEITVDQDELVETDPVSSTVASNISGLITTKGNKFAVDSDRLSSVLKRVKVKNKNIEAVISKFVEEEINNASNAGNKLNASDVEFKVLQSISYALTGSTDAASTTDPAKLIARMAESETYSIPLKLPELDNSATVSPADIIPQDMTISGINRHQFEYKDVLDSSVKDLFKSLTTKRDTPIQVRKIKSEIIRDNKNSFTVYTITLQNTSGGETEPYDVTIKLPALVNDKYLLLGGKTYMPLTQQFLKPIVKDKKNEVRFLTQFNTDTMRIRNATHTIGDYAAIIELMETKYPELLTSVTRNDNGEINHVRFDNGAEFWRNNPDMIVSTPTKVIRYADNKKESGVIIEYLENGETENSTTTSEVEIIFNEVYDILVEAYPHESKLSKQEPYIELHTAGIKIPYIIFLWQKYGLLGALVKTNIDHIITKAGEPIPQNATTKVALEGGSFVNLIPSSLREQYIANGIDPFYRSNKFEISESDVSSDTALDHVLQTKYRGSIVNDLAIFNEMMVDETTLKVLDKEGYPTDYLEVLNGPVLDLLMNGEVDHPNDLKNLRARQAEVIVSLLYQEIGMAHAAYRREVKRGNTKVKLRLSDTFVLDTLLGKRRDANGDSGSAIEWIDPYSPVSELVHASKVIRTGPGGVPSARQFRPEQRSIHKSAIGNISAHATPEYGNVGIVTHNCLSVQVDKDGFYGGKVNDTDNDPFGSVSISESLVPFQNQMNSDRLIMAVTHMDQKLPINEGEPVLVGTGAESIVPALSSNKFIHNATMDGTVVAVKPGKYITVEYKNGKKETFDLNYRSSHIAGTTNILLDMDTLKKGDKFKANQAVSWTKNFVANELANGKNMVMAVMSRMGQNFEDGYALSSTAASSMTTDVLNSFSIRINSDMKIISIVSEIGTVLDANSTVLERSYNQSEPDFIKVNDLEDTEVKVEKTKDTIKTIVPGGTLVDIKIRINKKRGLDPVLIKMFEAQSKDLQNTVKHLKDEKLDNTDLSVLNIGGHKDRGVLFDGALIEFFISSKTTLRHGDKLSGRFGTKGVITDIIEGEPKSEFTGPIDIFISPLSIMGRKNTAVIKELYIGKIMYHAPRLISELVASKSLAVARDTLLKVYSILDTTPKQNNLSSLKSKLDKMSDAKLKKALVDQSIRFNILYPPFTNIDFKAIRSAARILNIPLDEKVYLPALGTWTKTAVPVGINYISRMEQLSDDKESTRSTGGRVPITGQPHTGKSKAGGQSISEQDIYAMLNYDAPEILQELMNVRSDNVNAGTTMIRSLTTTGTSKLSDITAVDNSKTTTLLDNFMVGMGLEGRNM